MVTHYQHIPLTIFRMRMIKEFWLKSVMLDLFSLFVTKRKIKPAWKNQLLNAPKARLVLVKISGISHDFIRPYHVVIFASFVLRSSYWCWLPHEIYCIWSHDTDEYCNSHGNIILPLNTFIYITTDAGDDEGSIRRFENVSHQKGISPALTRWFILLGNLAQSLISNV